MCASKNKGVVVLVVLFWLLFPVLAVAQTKALVWERLDVEIIVLENGDFLVRETQVVRFTSGAFTFGYRTIPIQHQFSIDDVQVWEDGQPCQVSVTEEEGEYRIRWEMPAPRSDSRHTYVVQYLVRGGLYHRQDGDLLRWKAVFPDRSFPVEASLVTVRLPAGAVADGAVVYGALATVSGLGTDTVVFRAQERLEPGQEMEIQVQISGLSVGEASSSGILSGFLPSSAACLSVLAGVGFAVGIAVWGHRLRAFRYNRKARRQPVTAPPSDLPPGLAGVLVDGEVRLRHVLATVADLARRGEIGMAPIPAEGGGETWELFLPRGRKGVLSHYEWVIQFEGVFRDRSSMDGLAAEIALQEAFPDIRRAMEEEMLRRGLFRFPPHRARGTYRKLGWALLVSCMAAAVLIDLPFPLFFLIPVGMVGGMVLVVLGNMIRVWTPEGVSAAALWCSFRDHLADLRKYRGLAEADRLLEAFLPYAVAMGVYPEWEEMFSRRGEGWASREDSVGGESVARSGADIQESWVWVRRRAAPSGAPEGRRERAEEGPVPPGGGGWKAHPAPRGEQAPSSRQGGRWDLDGLSVRIGSRLDTSAARIGKALDRAAGDLFSPGRRGGGGTGPMGESGGGSGGFG